MLDKLKSDVKTSLLSGDRFRAETLKMVQAAMLNARIAKGAGAELTEDEQLAVFQKEIKKRKESVEMYTKVGATEKAEVEAREIVILEEFVPKMLEGTDLQAAIDALDLTGLGFPDAMKKALSELKNPNKGEVAQYLKTKIN